MNFPDVTDPYCHCGRPIIWHPNGDGMAWTRYLCDDCDSERCDAPQEGLHYSCDARMVITREAGQAEDYAFLLANVRDAVGDDE